MKTLLTTLFASVTMPALAGEPSRLQCTGPYPEGLTLSMTADFSSNDQLDSVKAFLVSKRSKPLFVFGFRNVSAKASVKDPKGTNVFKYDAGYADSTTIYLPRRLSAARGSSVKGMVVMLTDGTDPVVSRIACRVK